MLLGWLAAWASAARPAPQPEVPAHVERARARVDWALAQTEAVRVLSEYLQVDTTNPPGNEDRGVTFLTGLFDAEGIPWERVELAPGRASVVARVKGAGKAPPLCLMHHIDVASAEPDAWPEGRGPLSGAVADGAVWGRGALDMKGLGVLELLVAAWLVRLEVPLDRDVVLLAVADEEMDNGGARQLAAPAVWGEIGCDHLLNEGGLGVRDALFDGQAVHAISVAEKGTLWVEVVAEGRAGHGSVPVPDEEAPQRLVDAMRSLERVRTPYRLDDAVVELLGAVGRHHGGLTGAVLQSRLGLRTLAWGKLKAVPTMRATLHDTVHLTGMRGAQAPNVVPSRVSALYDCRLLPDTPPEVHLARLQDRLRKHPDVRIEIVHQEPGNRSPVDDPLYEIIAQYAVEGRPDAVAGPLLSVGFTDSILLRPLGVAAYGYVPFEVDAEVAETMHGHGERVPVDQVGEGLRRLFSMVVAFAGTPDAPG